MQFCIAKLGTTEYVYVTPIDDDGETRSTGKTLTDFTVVLRDPSYDDITDEVTITVAEYSDGSGRGCYRFSIALPSTGEGNYSFKVTDEFGHSSYATIMAYNFPPKTDTRDATAQVELEAYEVGVAVGTLEIDESGMDLKIWNPSMEEVSGDSSIDATLTKIEDGRFLLEWDCSSEEGEWFFDAIHDTYFPGGQQEIWRYEERAAQGAPTINSISVSDDGLTVTVNLTVGDAPYCYARLLTTDGTVRDSDLRSSSGNIVLTRAAAESGIVVVYGCDEEGFPASPSVARVIIDSTTPDSNAASDNIPVAIRTMKSYAVYWSVDTLDDHGQPTYSDPVLIGCRWDDVQEEFVSANGDREMSRARVIVDRDLEVKGVLMHGTLSDVSDQDDPKNNDGAWEIRSFSKTPDFKGKKFLRQVYL